MAQRTPAPHNRLAPPSVHGLEGSREVADQRNRRKRVKARFTSAVVFAILAGVVLAAGYVGYELYTEQRADEQVERDVRLAEIQAERAGRTSDDLIDQLEDTPRWNGPGAPAFGVGEEPAGIEITDGNVGG